MRIYFLTILLLISISNSKDLLMLPHYEKKSYMDNSVQEFLERKGCATVEKKVNRDLLGRRTSSELELNAIKCIEQKMMVDIVSLDFSESEPDAVTGRYEVNHEMNRYFLNGTIISKDDYFTFIKKIKKKKQDMRYQVKTLSASEIEKLLQTENHMSVSKHVDGVEDVIIHNHSFKDYQLIFSNSGISTHAFANGYDGTGIGIFFREKGKPHIANVVPSRYNLVGDTSSCNVRGHASGVVSILQKTAPGAMVYGTCNVSDIFSDPDDYETPVQISTNSWSESQNGSESYNALDANFDNYVYNYRVITFVAAGNEDASHLPPPYRVKDPGKSLNSITVGAVAPETGRYEDYSCWKNSEEGFQKPEVANYTDFALTGDYQFGSGNTGYNATFGGTSAATPYTAAMTADILHQHPFFKRHPEVFKALILTGSTIPIVQGSLYDSDNTSLIASSMPHYASMAWNTRSAYWNGGNDDFFDADSSIVFTESGIEANKKYRIAISWLVPGSYVLYHHVIPQDIDLYVYQNGDLIAQSTNVHSPFEMVSFRTRTSGDLVIQIKRFNNSGVGNVILGYNMLILD